MPSGQRMAWSKRVNHTHILTTHILTWVATVCSDDVNPAGEDKLKVFINFVLHYIADLDIPIKRGTFVEFRNGGVQQSGV